MLSYRRKILLDLLKFSDVLILILAMAFASWLVTYRMNYPSLVEFISMRIRLVNFVGFLGMILLWHIIFQQFHLYRSRRLEHMAEEWRDILKATATASGVFLVMGVAFRISLFTPYFILVFWFSASVITITVRGTLRMFLRRIRAHGRNLRNVIIVGTNPRAYAFGDKLEARREMGYCVVGYVDDVVYTPSESKTLLGRSEDFHTILRSFVVDEVVISLPIKSNYEMIQHIVACAEEQGVMIRHLYQLFDTKVAKARAEEFVDSSVLTMTSWPFEDWQFLTKRVLDVTLGTIFLVIASPVMLAAAIAIKLSSPGPVLFVQKRVGHNKRLFNLYKFRTMVADAERMQANLEKKNEMDGPVFKIQEDPRVTRVGRFLRKTSIDELPQLFNVLKGDMSLVGPRPLPVRDYDGFDTDWHRRRFSVPPGITCTWQVNGRNEVSFDDWMKLDMEYIDNWTLSTDFKILLKTIPTVLARKGAS